MIETGLGTVHPQKSEGKNWWLLMPAECSAKLIEGTVLCAKSYWCSHIHTAFKGLHILGGRKRDAQLSSNRVWWKLAAYWSCDITCWGAIPKATSIGMCEQWWTYGRMVCIQFLGKSWNYRRSSLFTGTPPSTRGGPVLWWTKYSGEFGY